MKLIYHDTLQEAVREINISVDPSGAALECTELYAQAYIPASPALSSGSSFSLSTAVKVRVPKMTAEILGFSLGNIYGNGFSFARGSINLLTGECIESSCHSENSKKVNPYSTATSHFYGPVELTSLNDIEDFKYQVVPDGTIIGFRIFGYNGVIPAGTEILIRGR